MMIGMKEPMKIEVTGYLIKYSIFFQLTQLNYVRDGSIVSRMIFVTFLMKWVDKLSFPRRRIFTFAD